MKIRANKIFVCILFMMIFISKMIISVAPVFLAMNNKTVNAAIMQLEQETKNEKDDPDKDAGKDKKFFDEDIQWTYHPVQVPVFVQKAKIRCINHELYQPVHYFSVPTPPPDSRIV
ncbi:hypothetical protein MUGA111182_18410 [Mucilaginibacter galii]